MTCAASRGPRTKTLGLVHQYVKPIDRFGIHIAGHSPESDRGNRYLLIAMDEVTK